MTTLISEAEMQAVKAEKLPSFYGLNLLHIKNQVALLLSLIGREGIYDQYTLHDITHFNRMLQMLDWLIPESTKEIMSSVDWLLIVLSIYFHDLGLIVTEKEYKARNQSAFPDYYDKLLLAKSDGELYRTKVEQKFLDPDKAERFFYQEFVRANHARRIGMWIHGKAPLSLGATKDTAKELEELFMPLSFAFRQDLALICESHHLDDLHDFKKYKLWRVYGNSDQEIANLQYAAILLRAVDLLDIQSSRIPSIPFRVINPVDPLSQEAWIEEKAAVRAVRPQRSPNREGNSVEALSDTIGIYASFSKEDAFFGLTSYLSYISNEFRKLHAWAAEANKEGALHEFPWRYIDDTKIETEGFSPDLFEFTIDKQKILGLFVGYPLYNDTNVVIRELVQNSLDAVRLQQLREPRSGFGKVSISWNSKARLLIIEDNGTGMTEDVIRKHLLNVGASYYQDLAFRQQYPNFSSISRFGIGILSTFMIADTIEITTCHPDEERARQISFRSVYGQYLMRLLDKQKDEVVSSRLAPHGTLVKLQVRPDAEINVVEAVQKWIVVPRCEVFVTVDDNPPVQVGFLSPKEAIMHFLQLSDLETENKVQVVQRESNNITLAYALEWSEYFKEWTFLHPSRLTREDFSEQKELPLGTCVEGIRVEFGTPGFKDRPIIAIADATGMNAPKTNVARSDLEATYERNEMLRMIYSIYCDHIKTEMEALYQKRQFSLTWAAQESRQLLSALLGDSKEGPTLPLQANLLVECIEDLPMLLLEEGGERRCASPKDLQDMPFFWTIDSPLFSSAEAIVREMPGKASLSTIVQVLQEVNIQLPTEPVLCGFDSIDQFHQYVFEDKEVHKIKVYREQRRVDLRWTDRSISPRWFSINDLLRSSRTGNITSDKNSQKLLIVLGDVEIVGLSDEVAVQAIDTVYLLSDSRLANYLMKRVGRARQEYTKRALAEVIWLFEVVYKLILHGDVESFFEESLRASARELPRRDGSMDMKELSRVFKDMNIKCFNPSALRLM